MNPSRNFSESKRKLLERFLRGEAAHQSWEAPLETREPGAPIPLAPAQQQIWLHSQLAPDISLYNEPITLHYRGALDRKVLERSFRELLRRHEIWRTTLAAVDGQIVQAVHPDLTIALPLTDLSWLPEDQREAEALRLATADARRPFELGLGPLLRGRLIKFSEDYHRIYLTLHHIIFDGVAIYTVVLGELAAIYDCFSKGLPSPLPEPRYQYADYAIWAKRLLENDVAARQMDYWRQTLSGELPVLELPTDRPRPAVPSYRGAMETFSLSGELSEALKQAARAERVTLYMLLLATFKVLLYRYSGQEDILIGGATDGRKRPEFTRVLGYFLHTVALRSRAQADLPFREFLTRVKDSVLGALAASDLPFNQVVREIHPKRNLSRHPLFQVLFSMEPPPPEPDAHWDLTQMEVSNGASKLDLYLELDERPEGLIGRFLYSTDLFDAATIRRMIGNWMTLLEGILRDPGMALAELPLLPQEERRLVAQRWNQTVRPVPQSTIHELFESQAARTPQAVAVEEKGRSLTYRELNQEANRLARRLQDLGAGPEVLIGLSVERSCDMLVAVLAVLKAGAAYLPLDPALPQERLDLLLEDSQIGLLLTERSLATRLSRPNLPLVFCDEAHGSAANLHLPARPDRLAYVLYTSGSTGRPKGVEIQHSAVVNFLLSMRREPGFTAGDTTLALTTLSFDIAGLEIFLPLITGGRVVIAAHEDIRDPLRLLEVLTTVSPTVVQGTPAMWRALIEAGWKGDKKLKVLCGGEAMARDLAQQLLARCGEVWNMYGPTETTIWSTIHKVASGSRAVPIGRPIDNTRVYVLDPRRQLVPPGVVGELYIGGSGVARGYLHRPELTAERFVQEPSLGPGRLYRTGDLARWLQDGTLECLGRADNQIKIRGFRIEPEEIEAAILDHPEVTAAAVKAWTDASQHQSLTAYVVGAAPLGAIRTFLEEKLPQYMLPTRWVALDALPLTPNGKVDRKRLPQPDPQAPQEEEYVAPSGDIERRLVDIWESVLERKGIGTHDNFFDLGGHSLLVAKLLRRLEFEFGVRFSMASVFQAPTIEQFAEFLKGHSAEVHSPFAIPLQPRGSRTPLLWLYAGPMFRPLAARLGDDQPFLGIAPDAAETASLPENFRMEELAACLVRKIRGVQPEGPYNLGGWCAEGILAYEVAAQLRRQGSDVDLVILLDSINPSRVRRMPRGAVLASRIVFNLNRIASLRRGDLRQFLRERAASVAHHSAQYTRPPASFEARLDRAASAYEPKLYGGRVVAIMPSRYPSYRNPETQWLDRVTGEFQVKRVSGNHVTMLEEPWVPDLASCIASCLEEAERVGNRQRVSVPSVKVATG
jgi:amino acid adenylation domain-containing protein